jgi:hypothetical protein
LGLFLQRLLQAGIIALSGLLAHHGGNKTSLALFCGQSLGYLNLVANPVLLAFAFSFCRPLRLPIMWILHHPGGMHFDRFYLASLFHNKLLGEDFSQKRYLFSLTKFARQRL